MGLVINSTEEKKLHINGLSFKPESVYARLRFMGHADGKKMEIQVDCYETKQEFLNNAPINVHFEAEGKVQAIQVIGCELQADEVQSVEMAHKYASEAFVGLGYEVTIDL